MVPKEKISERASAVPPSACSGDMYPGVPRIIPTWVVAMFTVGVGTHDFFALLGQAKIEQLDRATRSHQNVLRLQVAMDDAHGVRRLHGRGDLHGQGKS